MRNARCSKGLYQLPADFAVSFIYDSRNDGFRSSDQISSNNSVVMKTELGKVWKEAAMV